MKVWSVFTDDLEHCFFTGTTPVEVHHIFGGANRKKSTRYGFCIPLRPDLHPNGVHAGKNASEVDALLKEMAQAYYELNYGTREQFRKEFGKSYL